MSGNPVNVAGRHQTMRWNCDIGLQALHHLAAHPGMPGTLNLAQPRPTPVPTGQGSQLFGLHDFSSTHQRETSWPHACVALQSPGNSQTAEMLTISASMGCLSVRGLQPALTAGFVASGAKIEFFREAYDRRKPNCSQLCQSVARPRPRSPLAHWHQARGTLPNRKEIPCDSSLASSLPSS